MHNRGFTLELFGKKAVTAAQMRLEFQRETRMFVTPVYEYSKT
jgi:hypothetical protein